FVQLIKFSFLGYGANMIQISNLEFLKNRKYLFVGVTVLFLVVIFYRMFPVVQGLHLPEAEIALKQKMLEKYKASLLDKEILEGRLESLKLKVEDLEKSLLPGATPALAAVQVQNILQGIMAKSNVEIKSMRVLSPSKDSDSPYINVSVQFSIQSTNRELKEILYKIGTSSSFLRIKDIRIRTRNKAKTGWLSSVLTVEGLMKKKDF
ncbi:MAG TPA: hypothetical protein DD405_01680, partial [Desulfobacteraceae bacterium]|nr:hypothetical protein [Desulfobacteraceae bacterium]